ncbi:MAG: NAD(P) transhydrogenase subunit alpha [Wenzhouxiangella sp.]|jgi:NAD(P) transhydrogenase subunit alpha|nr:NAD(P) transhydrogenase subunit alpha [Wenzhouxiangella sp.]
MSISIGIIKETAEGERRVALDPPTAGKLTQAGHKILLESGAGAEAGHPDGVWKDVEILDSADKVAAGAQVLLCVRRPTPEVLKALPEGALVIGSLSPYADFDQLETAAKAGVSLVSMELVPRITRAQAMDVLSSQATVAGYKAVIIAADVAPRLFPMLTTAAGTLRPAKAVVIGAGVAGLQAIATARRLGAQVEAYDIRAAAREQVESLGAKMIDTGVDAETEGGYARELTDDERAQQADALARHLARADVVISTAAIPGRPAPKIITEAMVNDMQPGSVIVDIAAETGGNCELTEAGKTVNAGGVLIVGPTNLPSKAPLHASEMYAKNINNLLALMVKDGELVIDAEDEVIAGCLLAHGGKVVHEKFKS